MNGITKEISNKVANMSFVCALLVAFIHIGYEAAPGTFGHWLSLFVRTVVAQIAVPFFFVVSGFFLAKHIDEPNWWRRAVFQRVRTLLIPFLIWNLVEVALWFILNGWPNVSKAILVKTLVADFGLNPIKLAAVPPLWYVRALLLFVVISPLLLKQIRSQGGFVFICLFVVPLLLRVSIADSRWTNLWRFFIPIDGLFYFCLGMKLNPTRLDVGRKWAVLSFVMWLAMIVISSGHESILTAAAIPFLIVAVWQFIPSRRWYPIFAGSSFAIYVMHWTWGGLLKNAMSASPWFTEHIGSASLLRWSGAVGLSILIWWLLRRFCPRVAGVVFGGR